MRAPSALKWGPTFYVILATLLGLGLGVLIFSFASLRPVDIAILSVMPLLIAATCLLCARRLSQRRATALRPMRFVWAATIGLLAHGLLALVLTGFTYLKHADLTDIEAKNLIFAVVEVGLGVPLVTISGRMRRSAAALVQDGVLT